MEKRHVHVAADKLTARIRFYSVRMDAICCPPAIVS